jgi:hypothetical protein
VPLLAGVRQSFDPGRMVVFVERLDDLGITSWQISQLNGAVREPRRTTRTK